MEPKMMYDINKKTLELIELIDEINDIFFQVVKKIYSVNFSEAKKIFYNSSEMLESIVKYPQTFDQSVGSHIKLDIDGINDCMQKGIDFFENRDYQSVVDLLLYDFSNIINEYQDQLKIILNTKG